MHFVHRLVASEFIEGQNEMVNHKDFNPLNNNADNLEWTDRAGNMHYSAVRGRFDWSDEKRDKIRDVQIKLSGRPVRCLDPNGNAKEYECMHAVAVDGHLPSEVCRCCKGIRKTHHGMRWEYV